MKRRFCLLMSLWLGLVCSSPAAIPDDAGPLLGAYYRYHLAEETSAQAARLCADASPEIQEEVSRGVAVWRRAVMDGVKQIWTARFGDDAASEFQVFVEDYTQASDQDRADYLAALAESVGLPSSVASFADLRDLVIQRDLAEDLQSAAEFLGNIEIWLSLRLKDSGVVPLADWLARDTDEQPVPREAARRPRPSNSLRAAEVPLAEFDEEAMPETSTMDRMSDLRNQRRAQALENAQEGMRQIADERRSAEEEYAAAKSARAQANADAIKAQAQKLAAAESEAIEQSKNTWGNRLKRIVGTTVSSTVCAFTGGVGAVAADRAVQEVFN